MQVQFKEWLEATIVGLNHLLSQLGRGMAAKKVVFFFLAVVLSMSVGGYCVQPIQTAWVAVDAVDNNAPLENFQWKDFEMLPPAGIFHPIELDGLDEGTLFLRISYASRVSAFITGSTKFTGTVYCGHHLGRVYDGFELSLEPRNFIRLTITLKGNIVHDIWFRHFDPDALDTIGQPQSTVLTIP